MAEARVLYGGGSCTVWGSGSLDSYGGGVFCMAEAHGGHMQPYVRTIVLLKTSN